MLDPPFRCSHQPEFNRTGQQAKTSGEDAEITAILLEIQASVLLGLDMRFRLVQGVAGNTVTATSQPATAT